MKYNYYHSVYFDTDGYVAQIPAFNATVVDDNLEDLEKGIEFAIESGIEDCKEEGIPVPPEDGHLSPSGNIALRLPKDLHKQLLIDSRIEGVSMNQLILYRLTKAMYSQKVEEKK